MSSSGLCSRPSFPVACINELVDKINSEVKLFVDDGCSVVQIVARNCYELNKDLEKCVMVLMAVKNAV